jgi:deoxyribonucleoside regulator
MNTIGKWMMDEYTDIKGSMKFERKLRYLLAELYYEQGIPQNKIAEMTGMSTTMVNRKLKETEDDDSLIFHRVDDRLIYYRLKDHRVFSTLEKELKDKFKMKAVRIVRGNKNVFLGRTFNMQAIKENVKELKEKIDKGMEIDQEDIALSESGFANVKEAILEDMTIEAAFYLDSILKSGDVVATAWGRMMRGVVNAIVPSRYKEIEDVAFVSMLGIRSYDIFDSNRIAADLAAMYGSDWKNCGFLPFPAVVSDENLKNVIESSEYFIRVKEKYEKATVAITSIGWPNPRGTAVLQELIKSEVVDDLKNSGAVGEINSHFFDGRGKPVNQGEKFKKINFPIGMNLENLIRMANDPEKTVIGVAGAKNNRLDAIYACIAPETKIINVLITDNVTAMYLLEKIKYEQKMGVGAVQLLQENMPIIKKVLDIDRK